MVSAVVGIICTTVVYGVLCTRGLLSDGVKLEGEVEEMVGCG
jgi:hypothetical protein